MSDMRDEQQHDTEEHNPGIRTPRQLVTVVFLSFVVPIITIILLVNFVVLENKESPGSAALATSAVEARIAPVGTVQVSDPNNVAAARTGEQVFQAQCTTCHTAGLLGAPKFGDASAWGPRITQGYEALLNSALKGKGNMPAQSGGDFSNFEVGRGVVYMANKGGAHFAEPAPPQAASAASAGAASDAAAPAASAGTTAATATSTAQ